MLHQTAIGIGNEVDKGLRFGWDERRQIVLELTMFVPLFLLWAALAGQADAIVAGRFEWTLDDRRTGWPAYQWQVRRALRNGRLGP